MSRQWLRVGGMGVARLARAVSYGTSGVFVLALQGVSEEANWADWTKGSMSDGGWIGAATGAGVGFLIGFVAGLAKAGSGWSAERTIPPACPAAVVEPTASTEEGN